MAIATLSEDTSLERPFHARDSAQAGSVPPLPMPSAIPSRLAGGGARRPLGVVTASLAEAACWRKDGAPALACASGSSVARAGQVVERLLHAGVGGLVSFGLASGLAPALRPGDVVVARSVVLASGAAVPTDEAWRALLLARLAPMPRKITVARVVGGDRHALSVAEKRHAFMDTFAAALDTESRAVAEAATAAGLPFLVVRAIADPAEEARPAAAIAGVRADGGTRSLMRAAHLLARPGEIAAMWRFAQGGRVGLAALRQVARLMPAPPEPMPMAAAVVAGVLRLDAVAAPA